VHLDDLQLFRDIARARNLSRGASLNGISQSSASQRLHELEKALGVTLFDRSTRPIALTPAGHVYLEFCSQVLRRRERLDAELDLARSTVGGTVRVASIYSVGLSDMTRLRREFEARWPDASLEVEYLRPDRIYEAVRAGAAEIGIVSYPVPVRNVVAVPWREEPMAVAVTPGHPLAGRAVLEASDLQGREFISFDPELPIRRAIDRYLRSQGVEVVVSMHFDNIQMVKEAVAVGAGVSILPRRALRAEIELGLLAAVSIRPEITRPLAILHRRGRKFNNAARYFLELLLVAGKHDQHQPGREPVLFGASNSNVEEHT
jgi:LysR family transcriptional regulator, transcriptional activator of the cysJI operon